MKKLLLFTPLVLLVLYFLGPTLSTPTYDAQLPSVPQRSNDLEGYVAAREAVHQLKPGNEAGIIWADPIGKKKTPVAIVYLHGFSASQQEGFPTHKQFADKFGCNLYLARISDHGIDTTDVLYQFTPDRAWASAKEAYAIGSQLGDEVVIMSTSTGGTLALLLASTYPEIKGLINFSPNIAINDPAAFLLNDPWGLQIARLTFGSDFREVSSDENYAKYWYPRYRLEGVVALEELVETACTSKRFAGVKCPVFNGVYYRDETHQDPVVKVEATREMHRQLGGPAEKNELVEFPTAGDHVICSDMRSGALPELMDAISLFAESKLGMKKALKPVLTKELANTGEIKGCCMTSVKEVTK